MGRTHGRSHPKHIKKSSSKKAVAWCAWCDHAYYDYNRRIEDQHFSWYCPGCPVEVKETAKKRLSET
jgi:hypothetical protein